MTPEQYLKKLQELKAAAERAMISQAPSLERLAYDLMNDLINSSLDTQGGKFVVNEDALRFLNTFVDQFLGAFTQEKTYKGTVAQYLKNLKSVGELMDDFYKAQGLPPKLAKIGAVQEIMVNEVINRYGTNGLNAGFAQPLRELLFNNITGGTNKGQAMQQLREYIAGGRDKTGKLHRYLEQTAQQAVDSYEGAINVRITQTFDINTLIMSGSLIKTSSPQCRFAINKLEGIIDRTDWPEVRDIAKENGLIEGTTFDNLPFNRLHWGCRHSFTPAVLTEAQRKALISNPVNN